MVLVGAASQMAGILLAVWLPAPESAAGGVLQPANPAHALIAVGFALVVTGALAATAGPSLYANPPDAAGRSLVLRAGAPIVVLGMLGSGFYAATSLDAPSGGPPVFNGSIVAGDTDAGEAAGILGHGQHGDPGEEVPEVRLDRATERQLLAELAIARDIVLRYPTVADVEAAGYELSSAGPGAHYTKWEYMDDVFEIERPEQFVAEDSRPDAAIIGLSYYVVGDEHPDGFTGMADRWHRHENTCFRDRLLILEARAEWECNAVGGEPTREWDGWMLHVWVVPGWENPVGVFSGQMPFRLLFEGVTVAPLQDP